MIHPNLIMYSAFEGLAGNFLGGLAGFNRSHTVVCTFDSGEVILFFFKLHMFILSHELSFGNLMLAS